MTNSRRSLTNVLAGATQEAERRMERRAGHNHTNQEVAEKT